MPKTTRRILCLLLAVLAAACMCQPALAAGVSYMPDVTAEMSDAAYWADLYEGSRDIILTPEEIQAFNQDSAGRDATMVKDLSQIEGSFDGVKRNKLIASSAESDAKYYYGWTYTGTGKKAGWDYFQAMIDNCIDPKATTKMPIRYGIAVERTLLRVFPSPDPILDDPNDPDFDYQSLSAVRVNEPLILYTTSADGKYYLTHSSDCSGWVPAEDVALCEDRDEWLAAWDLPSEKLLVVYGNKEYTDESISHPETARRMLSQGTALELVTDLEPDQLVGNRSAYHNYVVYLPVRRADGSYEKQMALIPETAKVSVGYLPLTMENIAMVALNNLGDAYGWGGMMDVEDCSGLVRTVYACFGLRIGRNSTWQWQMNMEKIDMANMSLEEKCLILDELPLGAALCFDGHEMMYLGKVDGKYYVVSTVSSIISPNTGKTLRVRDVMINTMDVKRGSGKTWLGAINQAYMPCYAKLEGKSYDFPATQWYHDGVAYCLRTGALPALDIDDTFGIGSPVSRGDLVTALWSMAGKPAPSGDCPFTDIPADDVAAVAAAWAAGSGAKKGVSDTSFAPDEPVTCGEALAALEKVTGKEVPALPEGSGSELSADEPIAREQLAMILYGYSQLPQEAPAEDIPQPEAIPATEDKGN